MSSSLLLLLMLSLPGFAFQAGEGAVTRVRQRTLRDLTQILSTLIALSILLAWPSYLVCDKAVPDAVRALTKSVGLSPNASQNASFPIFALFQCATLTLTLCFGLGVLVGKFRFWTPIPGQLLTTASQSPLASLRTGLLPPSIYASVLATQEVKGEYPLYTGMISDVQLSPEGRVELVALSQPRKTTLHLTDADKLRSRRGRVRIGDVEREAKDVHDGLNLDQDQLLIESEDIANLWVVPGEGDGGSADLLDIIAYAIVSGFKWLVSWPMQVVSFFCFPAFIKTDYLFVQGETGLEDQHKTQEDMLDVLHSL